MPSRGILPMHCSANIGKDGNTAIFLVFLGLEKQLCQQTVHEL